MIGAFPTLDGQSSCCYSRRSRLFSSSKGWRVSNKAAEGGPYAIFLRVSNFRLAELTNGTTSMALFSDPPMRRQVALTGAKKSSWRLCFSCIRGRDCEDATPPVQGRKRSPGSGRSGLTGIREQPTKDFAERETGSL